MEEACKEVRMTPSTKGLRHVKMKSEWNDSCQRYVKMRTKGVPEYNCLNVESSMSQSENYALTHLSPGES